MMSIVVWARFVPFFVISWRGSGCESGGCGCRRGGVGRGREEGREEGEAPLSMVTVVVNCAGVVDMVHGAASGNISQGLMV